MNLPRGNRDGRSGEMALAALAKHRLENRLLQMQTAYTRSDKLTKHAYQSHMFRAVCPVSLENCELLLL